jgi:hypothetical protein
MCQSDVLVNVLIQEHKKESYSYSNYTNFHIFFPVAASHIYHALYISPSYTSHRKDWWHLVHVQIIKWWSMRRQVYPSTMYYFLLNKSESELILILKIWYIKEKSEHILSENAHKYLGCSNDRNMFWYVNG